MAERGRLDYISSGEGEILFIFANALSCPTVALGTQRIEETREIIGRRALEKQRFSRQRMVEAENGGVQSLPAQRQERGSRGRLQPSRLGLEARAIDRITEQRMAYMREMNPNLMRAAGFQSAGYQGRRAQQFLDAPMRDGGTAARRFHDRHFLPLTRMAAERRVDPAGARVERAPGNREIFANQRPGAAMVGEQRGEPLMRGVGLCDDDQPGSVLVEAMDDAWPPDAADSREARAAMADQCVDERAGGMSWRGMDEEPRGLVDNGEVLVLVDDSQRHILAEQRRVLRRRRGNLDSRADEDLGGGIARPRPVDRDLASLDQRLEAGARKRELALVRRAAQESVQPLARVL